MIGAARELSELRAPLTFDLRHFYGVSIDDIGTDRLRWGELITLTLELFKETGSHVRMELVDENYPLSQFQAYMLSLVGGLAGLKGDKLERLFPKQNKPHVTQAERDEAHKNLLELYGINN